MSQLKTLVAMQLKDKIDYASLSNKKELFRSLLFTILKFGIVMGVVYLILFLIFLIKFWIITKLILI